MSISVTVGKSENEGWTIYCPEGKGGLLKDSNGDIVKMDRDEAIARATILLKQYCPACGSKLRKSEGDGLCSDCMETQCKEKTEAEADTGGSEIFKTACAITRAHAAVIQNKTPVAD